MNKIKILFSIILIIVVAFVTFKFIKYRSTQKEDVTVQEEKYNFSIVYQAKRLGVTTQNTCSFAPYGGIKREMNKVNLTRLINDEILYLDAGNSLAPLKKDSDKETPSQQRTNKESALSIAKKLVEAQIDALGVGATEVGLSIPYLKEIEQKTSIPFVSSNIKYKNKNTYPFKRYILKTINNVKIAIISIVDSDYIKDDSIEVQDPKQVIEELVPELNKTSDFIILLSQLSVDKIDQLISEPDSIASNIKIVISSDLRFSAENIFWLNQGKNILANLYTNGYYIGKLDINYRKPFVAFSSDIELRKTLAKLQQIQTVLDSKDTPEKRKKALQKTINRINKTYQVTEIPNSTNYRGEVIGLDASYDL